MSDTTEPTVELLEREWATIYELYRSLEKNEWALPTDCPGWTVKDQISHIIGTELMLSGEQPPGLSSAEDSAGSERDKSNPSQDNIAAKQFPYVKNPIGEANELWVEARRRRPPEQLLEEFHQVTTERLTALRSMSEGEFAKVGWTPAGQAPYREFMAIRVFDCWVHEQDIRRAANKPGNLTGRVANHSRNRIRQAMPFVIGKKVQPQEGSIVVFHITNPGEIDNTFAVKMDGDRAAFMDQSPNQSSVDTSPETAYLDMDFETFACLACGRWDPDESMEQGKVSITGDAKLGSRAVRNLNFMI